MRKVFLEEKAAFLMAVGEGGENHSRSYEKYKWGSQNKT